MKIGIIEYFSKKFIFTDPDQFYKKELTPFLRVVVEYKITVIALLTILKSLSRQLTQGTHGQEDVYFAYQVNIAPCLYFNLLVQNITLK